MFRQRVKKSISYNIKRTVKDSIEISSPEDVNIIITDMFSLIVYAI